MYIDPFGFGSTSGTFINGNEKGNTMTRAIVENNNFKVIIHNNQKIEGLSNILELKDLPDFEFKFLNSKKEIVPVFFCVELKNKEIQSEIDELGHQIVFGSINSLIMESLKTVFEIVFIDKENPQKGFEGFLIDVAHPGYHNHYFGRAVLTTTYRFNNTPHPVVIDAQLFLDALRRELQFFSSSSLRMDYDFRLINNRKRSHASSSEELYTTHITEFILNCKFNLIPKNAFKVAVSVTYFDEINAEEDIKAIKESYKKLIEVSGIYRDSKVHLVDVAKVVYATLTMESNISNSTLNLQQNVIDALANETLSIIRERMASMLFLDVQTKKTLVDLTREEVRS